MEELGLSRLEARAYRSLLDVPAPTAGNVATMLATSRARAQDTLRSLALKGVAREVPGRPIRYVPVPAQEVLGGLKRSAQRRIDLLDATLKSMPRPQPASGPRRRPVRPGDVTVLSGRAAVGAEIVRITDGARAWIAVASRGPAGARLMAAPDILPALVEARARGVTLTIVLSQEHVDFDSLSALADVAASRLFTASAVHLPIFSIVANERVGLFQIPQPDDESPTRGDDVAIRIEMPEVLRALRERIAAMPSPRRPPIPIADPIGVRAEFAHAIANTHEDVLGLGTEGWSKFAADDWEPLAGAFEQLVASGVRLRGIVQESSDEDAIGTRLGKDWDVRTHARVPVCAAILDRRELFFAYPAGAETGGLQLRHSTDRAEVQHWLRVFEAMWAEARPRAAAQP